MKKLVLTAVLILSTFGAAARSHLLAANSEWGNLRTLRRGEQLRVVLNDAKFYQGKFQTLDDGGITLRGPAGEQTFARNEILRVSSRGKNHRLRNMVIGAAVGASLGIPVMLANRRNSWWRSSAWVPPVFAPVGGLMGAAIPTGGWHEVYRAH